MLQIKNTLGGGKPNAPYAWAKYEYEVIPPIDAVNPTFKMSSSSYTVTITESTVDLTSIGDNWREFFDGFKYNSGDYPKFQNGSDLLRIYASSSTASRVTAFTATSPTTGTLTLQDSWSKSSTLCEFIGTKHIKDEESKVGSFIEYITDKSSTKYPNGEVHTDGYFYRYALEGLYVWKKYDLVKKYNINSVKYSTSSNPIDVTALCNEKDGNFYLPCFSSSTYTVNSEGYFEFSNIAMRKYISIPSDGSTINFDNALGTYRYFCLQSTNFPDEESDLIMSPTANEIFDQNMADTYTYAKYDSSTDRVIVYEQYASNYFIGLTTEEYYEPNSFLDYIVSDKETAYPDGGEKGGYWYEAVSDAKIASGSITPSSSPTNLVIEHGLGKTPKQFYLLLNEADFTSYKVVVSAYKNDTGHRVSYASPNGGIYNAYAESSENFPEAIFDETNITVPTCYSSANKNSTSYVLRYYGVYKWFAIA